MKLLIFSQRRVTKVIAPAEVRGPFAPTATNVPGLQISEIFPRMATHADKYSLIRSVYHTATAVHDTGYQMMQTGRLFTGGIEHPHAGCVLGYVKGEHGLNGLLTIVDGDYDVRFCEEEQSTQRFRQ